jgi:hypothetical protein
MTSHIDKQLENCLTDMESMKIKMNELLDAKKEEEKEKENKLTKMDRNIAVLNNWLKKNKQLIEEETKNKTIWNTYSIPRMADGRIHIPDNCNISSEERKFIINYKETYTQQKEIQKRKDHFSYDPIFMEDFIKANYNIFNLQQKQIDELKDRLEKLEKIEKITLF